jgi:superfamily II DNA or RNA helicase
MQLDTHLNVPKFMVDMDRVRSDLWIPNLDYERKKALGYRMSGRDLPGVQLYEEFDCYVKLPRGYSPPSSGAETNEFSWDVEDMRPEFDRIEWPKFRRILKDAQIPAAHALVNQEGDKQLCLGCGKGKTTLSLWYSYYKSVRTLIIVDRDFLVDQWISEIKKCFWLPRDRVGRIQAQECSIGQEYTIAVIHTLSQHEYDDDFYAQFGLIIVDECHMLGAPLFASVLPRFVGERVLLSATPSRKDGMHPVFMYHGGGLEPCYTDLARDKPSTWYFVHMPRIMSEKEERSCFRRVPSTGRLAVHRPIYESKAIQSDVFNGLATEEIMKAAASGRNVLVLGSRVEQLKMLAEVVGEHHDVGLVTGDVKGEERRLAFSKRILFVTDRIGSRALDVPRLDTLVLLFPTADVDFLRQTVGRIDREHEEKREPIAIVFFHKTLEKVQRNMASAIKDVDDRAIIREVYR